MPAPDSPRRDFLKTTLAGAAAAATPYVLSAKTRAQEATEKSEAAEKMPIGVIGCGGMGMGNIDAVKSRVNVVAAADVDSKRAQDMSNRFGGGKAEVSEDYRKMLDRQDIKLIHIATPDHWHTKPLIEAMLAGKDIYCEKPLTLTIDEGKLIRKIQKQTGAIVQVGTQQRSTFHLFTKAMAIVNEGRLGKIQRVQAAIGAAPESPAISVAEPPKHLNWEKWLGPAPEVDYRNLTNPSKDGKRPRPREWTNGHYEFRWWYQYSGGKLTDWGAHHVDICNWALKLNGQTEGPTSIGGTSEHPVQFQHGVPLESDRYNTATKFNFTVKYPGGTEMIIRDDTDNGALIVGDKGKIFVNRGKLVGKPVDDLKENPLPKDAVQKVYKGMPMVKNARRAHWENFFHCVKERKDPISDVHTHMQMLNVCHLAGITARLGRELKWDDVNEQIVGDDEANSMLARPYREGYEIEMG
ncbi:Gfo/Idh/MocA family protein [Adhaeretor mobilis]|uniref:Inositol 2-dehydrogenase n=1 Tax=Adhaeretor mobilis TaxID=1930276 RepID=A0A517MZ16_9BACT|nr:Gfo/Idh/MocA family oxidoreductase [Adhaeretor mobilis]QDT00094.1 Inositol 2-dehydrogenase [Adhaeretor mobilis]